VKSHDLGRARVWALSFCMALGVFSDGIGQQQLKGRVVDPQGKPVPSIEVTMHAVTDVEGGDVGADTTDANGTFQMKVPDVPNAVIFVAVVYKGELFMGDMLRAPFTLDQDYVVQVGVNPVEIGPPPPTAPEVSPEEQKRDRSAGIAVILATLAVIAALVSIVLGRRAPVQRRWLVELARLEDDIATNPNPDASLSKRRNELRERLKAPKSG
jgi:hypothetical protein